MRRMLSVLACVALLAGCGQTRLLGIPTQARDSFPRGAAKAPKPSALQAAGTFEPVYTKHGNLVLDAETLLRPATDRDCMGQRHNFSCRVREIDLAADRPSRNAIIGQMIAASEKNCENYLLGLREAQITGRTTASLGAVTFGLAGGLTSPARNANILSSIGSLFSTTGAVLDRNLFAEQGIELIVIQIRQMRDETRTKIEANMAKPTYGEYPIGLALADVFRYHGQCNVMSGLSRLDQVVRDRDSTVRATNIVASELAARGATGQQIAAAVAGVSQGHLDAMRYDVPSGGARPSERSSAFATTLDLDLSTKKAQACLDKIIAVADDGTAEVKLTLDMSKDEAAQIAEFKKKLGEEPFKDCAYAINWDSRSLKVLQVALADADRIKAFRKLQTMVDKPPASATDAERKPYEDYQASLRAWRAGVISLLDQDRELVVSHRQQTATIARMAADPAGATPEEVAGVLRSAYNTTPDVRGGAAMDRTKDEEKDPLLGKVAAAADSAKSTKSAVAAYQQALLAANAYADLQAHRS
jgi:hypothetical protein